MSMYDFKAIQDSTIESKLMASQKLMPRQHHLANHRPPPPSMPCVPAQSSTDSICLAYGHVAHGMWQLTTSPHS